MPTNDLLGHSVAAKPFDIVEDREVHDPKPEWRGRRPERVHRCRTERRNGGALERRNMVTRRKGTRTGPSHNRDSNFRHRVSRQERRKERAHGRGKEAEKRVVCPRRKHDRALGRNKERLAEVPNNSGG